MKNVITGIWITTCLLFFQQVLLAQHNIVLKGRVFDKITTAPLAYASVYVSNSGTGVATNQFGEFTFHIASDLETSLLQISYIGYKKLFINISFLKPDTIYNFGMVSEIKNLMEVEITGKKGPSAADIVKIAISRIPKNYPQNKFLLHCYYRDYIKDKNKKDYKNLIEAAVIIEDRGFDREDYQNSRIKLEQIRYNPVFIADTSLNSSYDGKSKYIPYASVDKSNELALLRLQDPIRNHQRNVFTFVNTFDFDFIPNHTFHYESIIYSDSSKIFEIGFVAYRKRSKGDLMREYWANGKIYIDAKDYAILKFMYTVDCKLPSYSGKFFDLNLEYKNYKDKYYLNYMSLCNYFEYKPDSGKVTKSNPQQYLQYRELFVNNIVPRPFKPIKSKERIRKGAVLLSNKIPKIEGFWDHYNYTDTAKLIQ
jgi:hypothetical protein